jgi:aspartate/methionine/tyrosine aminotransferase
MVQALETAPSCMRSGIAGSLMTLAEEAAYLDPTVSLNAGPGYPTLGFGPQWIREIREHPPPGWLDTPPGEYIETISRYFAQRFGISERYRYSPSSIMLTRSCTEAFVIAAQAGTSPGDEVVVVDTSYDSYPLLLQRLGVHVAYARRDKNGIADPSSIAAACTDRTTAVVLVIPDNPLGVVTPRDVLTKVAALCRERSITLIVDYALIEANPFGADIPLVNGLVSSQGLSWIMLGDTSKVLGVAGAKFGAVMYPARLEPQMEAARSPWFFEFDQAALATVATVMSGPGHRWLPYIHQVRGQIGANYSYLRQKIRHPLAVAPLQAGCFGLIDVAGTGMSGEEFARLIREEHQVLVIPVSLFPTGHPGQADTRIRVALTRTSTFTAQLAERLNEAVR